MRVLLAVLSLTVTAALGAQFGPKGTIINFSVDQCYQHSTTTYFVADKSNLCWFWQCKQDKTGLYELLPRRCALGSKMPSTYIQGVSNPCMFNFNTKIDFDCTRSADELLTAVEPSCFSKLDCKNNGTAKYEDKLCWCHCPEAWRGATDCSKPTKEVNLNITGGKDDENCWKDVSPCDEAEGCENGGKCNNLCTGFWCDCPVPFTAGKRCEKFDCETNPCKNGGTCDRGEDNKDEVAKCECPEGFDGLLCENVKPTTTTTTTTTTTAAATEAAATEAAVTEAAATEAAATEAAVTEAAVTEAATTQAATTQAAATEAAATEAAVTEAAATEAAATEAAATEAAATEAATTQAATTQAAATEAAATEAAVTEAAATEAAVTQAAATEAAATEAATTQAATTGEEIIQPVVTASNSTEA